MAKFVKKIRHLTEDEKTTIKRVFEFLDTDKDGYLDYHEMKAAMKALGFEAKKSEVLAIMHVCDKQDGEKIGFEDFYYITNGNRFEGNFSRGKREGRGIFYHMKTGQLQEGCWFGDTCLASTIEDTYWRQSAAEPTPYPIPKTELKDSKEIIESQINQVSQLWDPISSSSFRNNQDYARGNIDCL